MNYTNLDTTPSTSRKVITTLVAALAVIGVCTAAFAAVQYHQAKTTQLVFTQGDLNPEAMAALFYYWQQAYGKSYSSQEEEQTRFGIFQSNYLFIANYNNNQSNTARMGLNEYADLSTAEFSALKGCLPSTDTLKIQKPTKLSTESLPSSWDWRQEGAVTPIKDQGQCGSCWAFSTTGTLEGIYFITFNTLDSFSEQQLVDCSGSFGNYGCDGGWPYEAMLYAQQYGMESEADYPYTAETDSCVYQSSEEITVDSGYQSVAGNDPAQLQAAVYQQPISVLIEADQSVFQFYTSGILNDPSCGTSIDHAVLAVGYGTDSATGLDYWIVKNSWGTSWGDQGYVYIANTAGAGICGINQYPTYPTAPSSSH